MKSIFRRVLAASVITSAIAFLFMLLAGRHVAMIFIKPGDTSLAEMSVTAIKLFSFSNLVGWIDMCFSSLFTALERPGRSLMVSFFGTLIFPIACLYLLTHAHFRPERCLADANCLRRCRRHSDGHSCLKFKNHSGELIYRHSQNS